MGQRVLVVDDYAPMQFMLRSLLDDAGYTVDVSMNGEAALDALRACPYPLVVLLDVSLAAPRSMRVLEHVASGREALATRHAYVVLSSTAEMLPSSLLALLDQLHAPLLAKPFNAAVLLGMVAEAVEQLERDAATW